MKKMILILVAISALVVTGIAWGLRKEAPIQVRLITVKQGPIYSYIKVTGTVTSEKEATLSAVTAGRVIETLGKEGQYVKRGELLARMDGSEVNERMASAEALLRLASTEVAQNHRRVQTVRSVWKVGGESYQAVLDHEAALQSSRAREAKAIADVKLARIAQGELNVVAPYNGTVTKKEVRVGQFVRAGDPLFILADLTDRKILARIDAGDASFVKSRQIVEFEIDGEHGKVWEERVIRLDPSVRKDGANSGLGVWISLSHEVGPIRLGQQVDVKIRTASNPSALQIPLDSLIHADNKTLVAKIQNGLVHLTPVVIGTDNLTHVELLQGLLVGEQVIVPEGRILIEGALVEPVPSK